MKSGNKMRIIDSVKKYMDEVGSLTIIFPNSLTINVLSTLKALPRSGKQIRLSKMNIPALKPRTIFDHICSLTYVADEVSKTFHKRLNGDLIANFIVYHDINEVLIGDIPNYTKECPCNSVQNYQRIATTPKNVRENIANQMIWLHSNKEQRLSIENLKYLEDSEIEEATFFTMLDGIDPILAVWRYMYQFRKLLQNRKREFIQQLNDFFDFPVLQEYLVNSSFPWLKDILLILTDKDKAYHYIKCGKLNELTESKETYSLLKVLIEEIPIFFEGEI